MEYIKGYYYYYIILVTDLGLGPVKLVQLYRALALTPISYATRTKFGGMERSN